MAGAVPAVSRAQDGVARILLPWTDQGFRSGHADRVHTALGAAQVGGVEEVEVVVAVDHGRCFQHAALPLLRVADELAGGAQEPRAVLAQLLRVERGRPPELVPILLPNEVEDSVLVPNRERIDRPVSIAPERAPLVAVGPVGSRGGGHAEAVPALTHATPRKRAVEDRVAVPQLGDLRGPEVRLGPAWRAAED